MAKKQFKAESKRLLDLMINSIYTHREIFLRELISNASDALDKLYYRSLQDGTTGIDRNEFTVSITPDAAARTLTITDNGIGMTKAELEENLGTIAKSGSLAFKRDTEQPADIDIIGQFGVGFYAAFMVADRVTVTSRAFGSDEAYIWESTGADGYTVTEAQKDAHGTEIVLHIKPNTEDDEYDDDFEFDLKTSIKSAERPVTVDIGFYDTVNAVFKTVGSVESYTDKTQLRAWTSSTRSEVYEFTGSLVNATNIRVRVDTTINKMWVFVGETLVTNAEGIAYYNPMGDIGIINAMRIAMDENLKLGDNAEISNIKLTQKLSYDVDGKAELIEASENVTIDMITNNPSQVTGAIKTLPSKVGKYNVKWSSLSPDVINVETGAVYGTEEESEVWVIAEIYDASANNPVNVKKAFKLTVPAASASGVIAYRLNLF